MKTPPSRMTAALWEVVLVKSGDLRGCLKKPEDCIQPQMNANERRLRTQMKTTHLPSFICVGPV